MPRGAPRKLGFDFSAHFGILPGVDFPYHARQILERGVLQQIRGCARGERAVDVFVTLIHRQDDDPRGWILLTNEPYGIDASHRALQ